MAEINIKTSMTPRHSKMNRTGLRIGRHYSPGGKLVVETARAALTEAASAIQLFPGNPQRYWGSNTTDEDRDTFLALTEHLHKVVHSVYITNIAENPTERGWRMTQHSLVNQLEWAERHGCQQLVFHPGSPKKANRDDALQWSLENLREVMIRYEGPVHLLLENAANPTKIGGDIPELVDLVKKVDDERVGICIDTTHAYAAGYTVDYMADGTMQHDCGDLLRCLHFNTPDAEVKFGSKLDRHSSTFEQGAFTYQQLSKLFTAWKHLPMILEGTPDLHHDLVWLLTWETEQRNGQELTIPERPQDPDDFFA